MKNTLVLAFVLGGLSVAIGAFGAHGLKPHLDAYQLSIFEKGVQYQFYHSLAIGICAVLMGKMEGMRRAALFFALGILFFSGSLYLLACRALLPFGVGWAGPITPIGGLFFIAGWAQGAYAAFRLPKD
jgi:uncharacterized membrane protein YgdD (TMEM256/DUF423 family)